MILDPKSALLLQPEDAWRKIFRQALEEEGFKVAEAGSPLEALTLSADRYYRVFVFDSRAALEGQRDLGGGVGIGRKGPPALRWLQHLSPIEDAQLLILTGPKADEPLLPTAEHWPASSAYVDRSPGVAKTKARLKAFVARPEGADHGSYTVPGTERVGIRIAVGGVIVGLSETGMAVRAPLFAPRPIGGFQCVSELFKAIGVPMPHAFLAESERLPGKAGDPMPQATLRFQTVGWNETERAALRSWMIQNRLKAVEP